MQESKNNKEEENVESSQRHPGNRDVEPEVNGDKKQCRNCFQEIHVSATVCQHCGQGQSFWRRHFGDIATVVSIVMVIVAVAQLIGAFKENVDASKAKETAETAAENANSVLAQVKSDANEIDRLKHTVENQGAMVELVSKQAFKVTNLTEDLSEKNLEMESKLKTLDLTTVKTVEILEDFQLINEFLMTVIEAQNDGRVAYDKLLKWSEDESFKLNRQAWQAWMGISSKHNPIAYRTNRAVPWKEGVDPSKLSLSELKRNYQSQEALSFYKPALIEYIWERQDIPKKDRMEFLVDVIRNDKSLTAVEYAGRFFSQGAGIKLHPLGVKAALKWWEENQDRFEN